jgi:two-component system sporulation sensor kinase A
MNDPDAPAISRGLRAFEEVVLQHSNDVGLLLHPKYGVVYASPAVEHVLGFTPQHFMGMLASSWVHPDDVVIAIEQRQLAVRNGHSGPVQLRGLHSDGTHHWFEAEWWHLANDHTVLHLRNVDHRREMADDIARHAARTITLLAHSAEIVLVVDPLSHEVFPLGDAITRLSGADRDSVTWQELLPADAQASFAALLDGSSADATITVGGTDYQCRAVDLTDQPAVAGIAVYLLPAH